MGGKSQCRHKTFDAEKTMESHSGHQLTGTTCKTACTTDRKHATDNVTEKEFAASFPPVVRAGKHHDPMLPDIHQRASSIMLEAAALCFMLYDSTTNFMLL